MGIGGTECAFGRRIEDGGNIGALGCMVGSVVLGTRVGGTEDSADETIRDGEIVCTVFGFAVGETGDPIDGRIEVGENVATAVVQFMLLGAGVGKTEGSAK